MSVLDHSSQETLADFVDEATASLRAAPADLAAFRRDPSVVEPMHAVFRAVHSIKGCASFLELRGVKLFAHGLENTLDEMRKGKVPPNEPLERAIVNGIDALEAMLVAALHGNVSDELDSRQSEALAQIGALSGRGGCSPRNGSSGPMELSALAEEIAASGVPLASAWADRLRSLAAALTESPDEPVAVPEGAAHKANKGPAPQAFERDHLPGTPGDVKKDIEVALQLFLAAERGEPIDSAPRRFQESCAAIAQFARTAGLPDVAAAVEACAQTIRALLDSAIGFDGPLLLAVWDDVSKPLCRLAANRPANQSADKPPIQENAPRNPAAPKSRLLRVREEKLNDFLEDVSGLFVTGELLRDLHARMHAEHLQSAMLEELHQITRTFRQQSTKLQEGVVSLRRVAAEGLLSKFPAMARTLAGQLGKRIDVHLVGEETEIDKSLLDDLDAPLTHMIRNVVDHGIEPPADRRARGRSEAGNLWLKASRSRTHVQFVVQDDGRGIDPVKLRGKAVEKGLLPAAQAAALSDREAIDLIFHPGFSTAEKISEVSGRGVGMDVVRTQIRQYNGSIHVESRVGEGTTFRIEIPIREAVVVIDGLRVRQAGQDFVIPFEHLREIIDLDPARLMSVQGAQVAIVRNRTYDALSLGRLLALPEPKRQPGKSIPAVLVGCPKGDACLLVDEVLGHRQVVVNGLAEVLPGMEKMAGVAQMGGGRLALVLSVPELVESPAR